MDGRRGGGKGVDGPAIKALAWREEGHVVLMYAYIACVFLTTDLGRKKREKSSLCGDR